MPDWATFAGLAGVVLVLLLLLAHASKSVVSGDAGGTRPRPRPDSADPTAADATPPDTVVDVGRADHPRGDADRDSDLDPGLDTGTAADQPTDRVHADQRRLPTMALLANVAVSQGAFGFLLVAGAWFTGIPAAAFGVAAALPSATSLGVGVALGVGLYVANEAGVTVGKRLGVGADEGLREALAPTSAVGWAVLLLVVLPVIAGFEELLFRGILVGVFATGFGVSPWLLAVVSSVAFALGHGAQGPTGVVVTGVLGLVLAAAFVLSGSLVVVIVAHYLVNALEFVVHEGFGVGRE